MHLDGDVTTNGGSVDVLGNDPFDFDLGEIDRHTFNGSRRTVAAWVFVSLLDR